MGIEIDLMRHYPRSKRDVSERGQEKTIEDREIARRFDKDFFDGSRKTGYGGYNYSPRFFQPVVPDFIEHFSLKSGDSILDVGCAKGFMLYDFLQINPKFKVAGIDISEYAIKNALEEVKPFVRVADARELPFPDHSFDLSISITTVHNFEGEDLKRSLLELQRVSKNNRSFITVDAYRNDEEKKRMEAWNLTAKTMMHVDEWKEYFFQIGYEGDFYWFIP